MHNDKSLNKKHSGDGFTLVELLVTISIIAILSIIGLMAYSSFMQNARNNKRQSDLKMIQSALEDFHADQLYYPSSLSVLTSGSRIYLNQVPNDPKDAAPYSYTQSGCSTGSIGYCLGATMENTSPSSDPNCSLPGSNYCVTRP